MSIERKRHIRRKFIHLKQFKYPLSRIPDERLEELNQILYNQNEVTVYCDSSVCLGHPLVGLSACYVGCGMTIIEAKKVYTKFINKTMYAELEAVKHAIETLPKILLEYSRYSCNPIRIKILSDIHIIEDFIYRGVGQKDYMRVLIAEINDLLESYSNSLDVSVRYIGDQKNQNIFHKASHNSARKAIGKK